jgi:hypothetical protein
MTTSPSSDIPSIPTATDPKVLYSTLFDLSGWDYKGKYKGEYEFLLEQHMHDNELDRELDIQYSFCVLWRTLVDKLWQSRRNLTRTLPFPLWLPLRNEPHPTDSYFVYYIDQLHYLLDANLQQLLRAIIPSTLPPLIDPSMIAPMQMVEYANQGSGTIFLVKDFYKRFMDTGCAVFHPKQVSTLTAPYQHHVLETPWIKYHMLRVLMYWLNGCVMIHRDQEEALCLFASLSVVLEQTLTPLVLEHERVIGQNVFQMYYDQRFLLIDKSARVQWLLIKADVQHRLQRYGAAAMCWATAHERYQWPMSAMAHSIILNHHSQIVSNVMTKEKINKMEPIIEPQLTRYMMGRLMTSGTLSLDRS